jgi:hypothetical protein
MSLVSRAGGPRRRWLAAMAACAAWPLAACSRSMAPEPAPALPGAQPFDERGPWDVAIASAAAGLGNALGRDAGPLELRRWALPAATTLAALQAQLQQALGTDWEALAGLPQRTAGAQLRGWRHRGLGRQPVFSLAWLDEPVAVRSAEPPLRIVVTASASSGG